jgi:hypothetical protein
VRVARRGTAGLFVAHPPSHPTAGRGSWC